MCGPLVPRVTVGKHRHFRMIALQGKIRDMTGVVLAFEEIWSKLGELYSLDDLDEMVRSSNVFRTTWDAELTIQD